MYPQWHLIGTNYRLLLIHHISQHQHIHPLYSMWDVWVSTQRPLETGHTAQDTIETFPSASFAPYSCVLLASAACQKRGLLWGTPAQMFSDCPNLPGFTLTSPYGIWQNLEPEHSRLHSLPSLPSLQVLLPAQKAYGLPLISGEKSISMSLYSFLPPLIFYVFYKNSIWASQAWFFLEEEWFWNLENLLSQ